uniref:[histone H3]-trimethyl-L-lysine(9) demethylase n=1 Tax=Pygocentrus nattereri TaxID=42514 RepID=A0AAR2JRK3_PYGNA
MASDTQSSGSKGIMTFRPTMEEFKNFSRYMAYIESQGAHRAGLAKIIPPKEWKPRRSYDDIDDLLIPAPIQQVVTGQSGLFTQYNIQKKAMTVKEFRKTANSDKFCSPRYDDFEELERKYWKNVTFNPPIYGADVNGTLYDPDVDEWNVGRLHTILDTVEHDSGITIEGVNTPYLYFGMWKTTFAWHTEDMDLYSINYLHFGEPKSWYCVPPEHGKRLERLAKGFFPGSSQNCEAFLRHKMTLISPSILKKYGIPFEKITQEAGEFMITFPYGYHAGFNHGFNCAESTNFATQRWIDYGKQAILCSCRKDMVKISMDVFVRKYQPERYELWLAGKDNVPIDHSKPTPEAAEFMGGKGGDFGRQEPSTGVHSSEGQKKSVAKQRIGTKRHRVCLEVPEDVLPPDEEASYGKKGRLSPREECCREDSEYLNPSFRQACVCYHPASLSDFLKAEDDWIIDYTLTCCNGLTVAQRMPFFADLLLICFISYCFHQESEAKKENKGMKRKLQPISKVPPLSPLLKDSSSDEVEVDSQETEPWARMLAPLWQDGSRSFKVERDYNRRMGLRPPYCAVCSLFHAYEQVQQGAFTKNTNSLHLFHTKPLIPEMCFTGSSEGQLSTPHLEPDGTSQLVSCSMCSVRVHTSECWSYFTYLKENSTHFLIFFSDCCLCSLRGGALQRTSNDKWVHVLCAVAVLEARFVNIADRRPVDLSGIPLQRFKLKCQYCRKGVKKATGCCVQCSYGRCSSSFHATCAQAAGVHMHPDDWPFVIFFTCWKHKGGTHVERNMASLRELEEGQKVICKHKNGRYYQCDVVELIKATFYEVIFDDGSFSDNLFPEDIVNRDCVKLGPPAEGDMVQVRWTDGLIYGGKFVAAHIIPMYQVEFEDESQLTAKREDVYCLDEELPKRVRARLSVASDMRFKGVFVEKEVKKDSKRQRVINSRYREDYIEPAIYRAIME